VLQFGLPKNFAPLSGKNICGAAIRNARECKNPPITQDQLAGKVAVLGIVLDRTAIAKIESGQRRITDYELMAIAHALNASVISLLEQ
jgi:HTH-type transcriptional regulator, cell division transcriptional repressor